MGVDQVGCYYVVCCMDDFGVVRGQVMVDGEDFFVIDQYVCVFDFVFCGVYGYDYIGFVDQGFYCCFLMCFGGMVCGVDFIFVDGGCVVEELVQQYC